MQNNVGPDRISSGRNFELSWPSRNRRHNDAAISISSSPTYHPSSFELPIVGNGGWGNADWELRWSHMANCTRETHSVSPWVWSVQIFTQATAIVWFWFWVWVRWSALGTCYQWITGLDVDTLGMQSAWRTPPLYRPYKANKTNRQTDISGYNCGQFNNNLCRNYRKYTYNSNV